MNILDRLFGRRRTPSPKEIAKKRLRLVLEYDRAGISAGLLQTLKGEIIGAISKHIEIDQTGVEVKVTQRDGRSRLVADIPLRGTSARKGS
ncbi:MAG TPA: cell division topological specificity factor MinE [Anaerolineae bacterium]|nr:cell division topological specificity factor MinE [Anaerolineae bacterium]